MEDLNSFLEKNCFVRLDDEELVANNEVVTGQVYLDVGEPALTILAAIRQASKSEPHRLRSQARRWVEY
jgi:hypothetical protein